MAVRVKLIHRGEGVLLGRDSPLAQAVEGALEEEYGREVVWVRRGSSIPVVELLERVLGVPVVLLGLGLPSDGIHGPNESYGLEQFERGMRVVVGTVKRLGGVTGREAREL